MSARYTTSEAAAELGIDASRVRRLAAGRGLGRKAGPLWVFTQAEVESMRERRPGWRAGRPRRAAGEGGAEHPPNGTQDRDSTGRTNRRTPRARKPSKSP